MLAVYLAASTTLSTSLSLHAGRLRRPARVFELKTQGPDPSGVKPFSSTCVPGTLKTTLSGFVLRCPGRLSLGTHNHSSGAHCSESSHDRPVGRSRRSPPPKVSRGTGGCASSPTWRARLRRQVVCHMCCWMNSCSSLDIGPCDARPQAGRARSGPSSHSSYHLTSHHRTSSSYRQRRCIRSSSHHLINTSSHRSHHANHTPHLSPYADT